MGIKSFVKNAVVKGFNVKKWVDYEGVKDSTKSVVGLVKTAYEIPETANKPRKETFEQAVQRLKLTEADIQKRMQSAYLVSISCAVSVVPMLVYAVYLFYNATFMSGLVAVTLSALLGAYAFRESFHYFQMKHRRLNCTVKEWFYSLF